MTASTDGAVEAPSFKTHLQSEQAKAAIETLVHHQIVAAMPPSPPPCAIFSLYILCVCVFVYIVVSIACMNVCMSVFVFVAILFTCALCYVV